MSLLCSLLRFYVYCVNAVKQIKPRVLVDQEMAELPQMYVSRLVQQTAQSQTRPADVQIPQSSRDYCVLYYVQMPPATRDYCVLYYLCSNASCNKKLLCFVLSMFKCLQQPETTALRTVYVRVSQWHAQAWWCP